MSTSNEGFVYVIRNDAFADWSKVGLTTQDSPEDRLKNYQTGDPYRSYQLHFSAHVDDCRAVEAVVHETAKDQGLEVRNEWLRCKPDWAVRLIEGAIADTYH